MNKISALVVSLLLLVGAVPAYAWTLDYQDPNSSHDLSIATDWFRLTDAGNPASRDGNVGPPLFTDYAYIRTGRSDLFLSSGSLNAKALQIGGESLTSNPPTTLTKVTVSSGAVIETRSADSSVSSDNIWIGYRYNGELAVDGGTVKAINSANLAQGGMISLGGKTNTATGTLTVEDGLVQFGRFYLGWQNGTGIVNQTGGIVESIAGSATAQFFCGYVNEGYAGRGEYNISGTGYLELDLGYIMTLGYKAGHGLFNQTGGSVCLANAGATSLRIGRQDGTATGTYGEYRLLGGKLTALGRIEISTGGATYPVKGKFMVNQHATLDCDWEFISSSTQDLVELIVDSAGDFDMSVSGNLTWAKPTFTVTLSSYSPTVGQTWKVVDVGTGVITLPSDGYHPDGSRYNWSGPDGVGWCLYKDIPNDDLRLEYVPEPATLALLGLGGLALLRRRRS